jgi:hypothetical protein
MVEVEGERENVLVRGPKWVSLSSVTTLLSATVACAKAEWQTTAPAQSSGRVDIDVLLVSFHDMVQMRRDPPPKVAVVGVAGCCKYQKERNTKGVGGTGSENKKR